MFRLRTNGLTWVGTNTERLTNFSAPIQEGLEFYETDTGNLYKMIQQSWVQINSGSGGGGAYLEIANNLSDVADAPTSLSNIGGEPNLGNPLIDGYILSSTTGGTRSWIEMTGGGGGVSQFTATVYASTSWDNETIPIWQAPKDSGVTITQVNATVMGVSTPSLLFNLEKRAYNTLSTTGTEVFVTDQSATVTGLETNTFSSAGVGVKDFIVLTTPVSAETGTVSLIIVTVYYEV